MVELYGTGFINAFGKTPSPLWLSAIERLTDDDCAKGLARLAEEPRAFPANLTQFVGACKQRDPVRFLGAPMTAQQIEDMNGPRADPAIATEWIAHLRDKVGPIIEPERELGTGRWFSPPCTCEATGVCRVCKDWNERLRKIEQAQFEKVRA